MYGGLELGFGAFFAYAAFKPELVKPALLVQTLGLGGLAVGRVASFVADRPKWMLYAFGALEAATAVLGAVQLAKHEPRRKKLFVVA